MANTMSNQISTSNPSSLTTPSSHTTRLRHLQTKLNSIRRQTILLSIYTSLKIHHPRNADPIQWCPLLHTFEEFCKNPDTLSMDVRREDLILQDTERYLFKELNTTITKKDQEFWRQRPAHRYFYLGVMAQMLRTYSSKEFTLLKTTLWRKKRQIMLLEFQAKIDDVQAKVDALGETICCKREKKAEELLATLERVKRAGFSGKDSLERVTRHQLLVKKVETEVRWQHWGIQAWIDKLKIRILEGDDEELRMSFIQKAKEHMNGIHKRQSEVEELWEFISKRGQPLRSIIEVVTAVEMKLGCEKATANSNVPQHRAGAQKSKRGDSFGDNESMNAPPLYEKVEKSKEKTQRRRSSVARALASLKDAFKRS